MQYTKPGNYIAICNKTNFDGHYVKRFTLPETDPYTGQPWPFAVTADWFFMNRLDFTACVDKVYPADIFDKVTNALPPFASV